MDRFIGVAPRQNIFGDCRLKSNMDRFIVIEKSRMTKQQKSLKSNMDRFIVDIIVNVIISYPV